MKLLLLAATLLLAGGAPAPDRSARTPAQALRVESGRGRAPLVGCAATLQQFADARAGGPATRLDRLPSADLVLAVDRQVDGCREVTVVRRNVGARSGD